MKRPALVFLAPLIVAVLTAAATLSLYPFVHFVRPRAFWWVLALIGLAFVWAHRAIRRARAQDALMHSRAFDRVAKSWSPRRDSARFSLIAVACFGLIIAAAQPQWGEQTRHVQRKGTDIVIVLDASRSMLAEDVGPDRMRAATRELSNLLSLLEGDRVGLVVFAGVAFTQSPLTSDYGAIRLYLDRVNPNAIPTQGTAIGDAIKEAHKLLTGGHDSDFRRAPHQMILVVSDGEDHETKPVEAAYEAYKDGILTYTVGVGTAAGGRIPLHDRNGQFERYLTDRDGNVVHTRLEDAQLHQIASAGGGNYMHFDGLNSTVPALASTINRFDEAYLSSTLRAHYVNRGSFFLWPAFLLLFLALLIDDRPRTLRPNKWWNILLVLLVATSISSCLDFRYEDPHVRRAIHKAEDGDYDGALKSIERANTDARTQHAYHFNRGRIYSGLGEVDDAQSDFLNALGASSVPLRVAALIGVGNTLVTQENYRDAITRYTRALLLSPNNNIARHNLEVAHRKQFPLCNALEDRLEPNDRADQASDLPSGSISGPYASLYAPQSTMQPNTMGNAPQDDDEKQTLTLCGGNDDWLKLPLTGGESVDVRAQFLRLREDDGGPPLPDRVPARALRMMIIDAHGKALATDNGRTQDRDENGLVPAKQIRRHIELPAVRPENAPYFLVLSADKNLEYSYDLTVEIIPPCSALEDDFEPNDSPDAAHAIDSGEHRARICNDNEDWFRVDLDENDQLFVDLTPAPGEDAEEVFLRSGFSLEDGGPIPLVEQTEPGRIAWASGQVASPRTARWGIGSQNNVETEYSMDVFRFGECPEGNDRFEPNDQPNNAAQLTTEQTDIRHLRLCPEDQDWFVMRLDPEENADKEDAQAFSARVDFEETSDTKNVEVELWDPVTGRRLATAQTLPSTPEAQTADDVQPPPDQTDENSAGDDNSAAQPRAVIAATTLPAQAEAVIIRVYGDETFYHLSFPDTLPPEEDSSDDSQDQDQGDEDDASDASRADDSAQEDESQEQEGDQGTEEDEQHTDPSASEDESIAEPAPSEEEAQRQALLELLNSLEDDKVNLQLQQALEREPRSRPQNEW